MLYLAYLGESKKLKLNHKILKILIVRKPVHGIPNGFIHVPQLSPSLSLFDKAQRWKNGLYTKEELFSLCKMGETEIDAWWVLYKREFTKELNERPDMVRAIKRLENRLKEGEEIYAFCYCKNVCRCHRGLIGEYLRKKGYEVDFRQQEENKTAHTSFEQLSLFE